MKLISILVVSYIILIFNIAEVLLQFLRITFVIDFSWYIVAWLIKPRKKPLISIILLYYLSNKSIFTFVLWEFVKKATNQNNYRFVFYNQSGNHFIYFDPLVLFLKLLVNFWTFSLSHLIQSLLILKDTFRKLDYNWTGVLCDEVKKGQ